MLESKTDLWTTPCDALCVTTNGYVKADGRAVMGRGCALQATQQIPGIAAVLGAAIQSQGLRVCALDLAPVDYHRGVIAFPVKYAWHEPASLLLIRRSAEELMALLDVHPEWQTVLLPRPGCGNGQLDWAVVRPLLVDILDNRVVVVHQ